MRSSKLTLGLLVAATVPFLMACPKAKTEVAPQPDKELQSSIDASFANHTVTDIDMIAAFVGENQFFPAFYITAPGEDPSKFHTVNIPINTPSQTAVYYNSAHCIDGIERDGSIFITYNHGPNSNYYRDYGYKIHFDFYSYKSDGWNIRVPAGASFDVYNTLSSPAYDPRHTQLTWSIVGSLEFIHPTDPSRNMTWNGKLTKTLTNSTDPSVFNPSGQSAIDWTKGIVAYTGEVSGVTSASVPYKMVIDNVHPLTRDFTCYPDKVSGISSMQPLRTWSEEFHPVKSGIVTFTTDDKYPRQIYYGNEGNPELPLQCDNSGEVLIKGISYRIDFSK